MCIAQDDGTQHMMVWFRGQSMTAPAGLQRSSSTHDLTLEQQNSKVGNSLLYTLHDRSSHGQTLGTEMRPENACMRVDMRETQVQAFFLPPLYYAVT